MGIMGFRAHAPIYLNRGLLPISDAHTGDLAYDADGEITEIMQVHRQHVHSEMWQVKFSGCSDYLWAMPEQAFLTLDGYITAADLTTKSRVYKPSIVKADRAPLIDLIKYGDFEHYDEKYIYLLSRHKSGARIKYSRDLKHVRYLFNHYLSKTAVRKYPRFYSLDADLVGILAHIIGNSRRAVRIFHHNTDELRQHLVKVFNYYGKYQRLHLPLPLMKALKNMAHSSDLYTGMNYYLLSVFLQKVMAFKLYKHPTNSRIVLGAMNTRKKEVFEVVLARLGIRYSQFNVKKENIKYYSLNKTDLTRFYIFATKYSINNQNRTLTLSGCYYKVMEKTPSFYTGNIYSLSTATHSYLVRGYATNGADNTLLKC